LVYYEALARTGGGDGAAIDTACIEAIQKFGATRNPDRAHWLARLCVLSTTLDDATRSRVRDLARLAADLEPDIGRFVGVYAAALVRAGDPAAAERLLVELLARPRVREREEETQLILAWAQRQLGRTRDYDRTLSRYADAAARVFVPWHRRLEADRWRLQAQTRN
jgi:hypothetical protein